MPRVHPIDLTNTPISEHTDPETQLPIQDDDTNDLLLDVATPSSMLNERPGKRAGLQGGKKLKWKPKAKVKLPSGGICFLLALPEDVTRVLLGRIPPSSLKVLGQTCAGLRAILEDEAIWRDSYVHMFMGSVRTDEVKGDLKVLVQGCLGGERGWKKEALGREAMIERWIASKATPVTHHPSVGLIHSLSLSYPVLHPKPRGVVGKTHDAVAHLDGVNETDGPDQSTSSPAKMTARQKYDARIAATTRPPPAVLSAGLGPGAIVKSDPISGKVSKGFWGPGRDANFHVHPQFNSVDPPMSVYFPEREQSYALWGRLDGSVVYTSLETKHPSAPGSRAQSVNTTCDVSARHSGEVLDVRPSRNLDGTLRFVTAGADGCVKYWQFNPGLSKGKKRNNDPENAATIVCLYNSDPIEPLDDRSDEIKRKRTGSPDPVLMARCNAEHDVLCGVTEDGDLRIWWNVQDQVQEIRLDCGAIDGAESVKALELDVKDDAGLQISVLVVHYRNTAFSRYDINIDLDGDYEITEKRYTTPMNAPLTAFKAYLEPSAPISTKSRPMPALLAPSSHGSDSESSPELLPQPDVEIAPRPVFGRFMVAGDTGGNVWIWPWESDNEEVSPMRGWAACERKITSLDYNCGIVAVGSCDAYIKVYDPLPAVPALLHTFRVHHLSPADLVLAQSDDFTASFLTVNQIILENDLLVAAVGRKVFAWKAGSGKKRDAIKGDKKRTGGPRSGRGLTGLDMRSLHEDVVHERREAKAREEERQESKSERQQWAAMEEMGLDADAALQYAMMLSMDEQPQAQASTPSWNTPREEMEPEFYSDDEDDYSYHSGRKSRVESRDDNDAWGDGYGDEEVDEAVRAVEEYRRKEEEEMRQALEMIRIAEERERRA